MRSSSVWRLFVKIDEYSRYPVVDILRSVSANAAISMLDKVISQRFSPDPQLNRYQNSTSGNPLLQLAIQCYFFK